MIPSLFQVSRSLDGFGPFLGAFSVRRSARSLSGWVCVLSFPSSYSAGAFARFWAPPLAGSLPWLCRAPVRVGLVGLCARGGGMMVLGVSGSRNLSPVGCAQVGTAVSAVLAGGGQAVGWLCHRR